MRKSTGKTEHSFFKDSRSNSVGFPLDVRFMEKFFEMSPNTFVSEIVEPHYGLRVDSKGQIKDLLYKILEEEIPLFINTIDLSKRKNSKRAYVVNGFEV